MSRHLDPKVVQDINTISMEVLPGITKVMMAGAEKHGAQSWKQKGNVSLMHKNNAASINRHLSHFTVSPEAWNEDEQCYHIENAIVRLAMALYKIKQGTYEE